tara:strand:- start:218 stop:613 length:396 start_codon:yes stop_codon:yes gene_type:complete
MIVDPVVVIPDMLSKNESMNDKLRSENINGKHPKIAMLSHDKTVKRKACCKFNFLSSSELASTKSIPINIVIEAEDIKVLFFSSNISCTIKGININTPNITRRIPIAKKTVLLLFTFEDRGYLKISIIQHN